MTCVERDCLRALKASAAGFAIDLSVELTAARAWSSALFAGCRLAVAVAADDDERLDHWLATLPDADLPIPHHFVASAEVTARSDRAAELELLLVEA